MKRKIKNLLLYAIAAVMICSLLSCSGKKNNAVTFYDPNERIVGAASQGVASLLIGAYKAGSEEYVNLIESMDNGWNTVADAESGATYKQIFKNDCVLSLKKLLAAEYLHDLVYSLKVDDEQQKSVENYIDAKADTFGTKDGFKTEMQKYGASVEDYERYLVLMLKQSNLVEYLYGSGGERAVTDTKIMDYFGTNYGIVRHIFFEMRGIQKDDGTVVSFSDEEREQRRDAAMNVYNSILDGSLSYDEAFATFNEDKYVSSFPNGYFVTNNGKYPEQFVRAALSLRVGEITLVETSAGIHIVQKLAMDESLCLDDSEEKGYISNVIKVQDFNDLLSTVVDGAKVDEDVIAELDASLILPFYG